LSELAIPGAEAGVVANGDHQSESPPPNRCRDAVSRHALTERLPARENAEEILNRNSLFSVDD
jgi:hypothetical protein